MSVEYTLGQLKCATEEKRMIWYMQSDGTLSASYKVGENEFALTLLKDHKNLIILRIALKNIMKTDILQNDKIIWPGSPADKLFNKIWKSNSRQSKTHADKLDSDLESIYEMALKTAIKPEQSREIIIKLISGL